MPNRDLTRPFLSTCELAGGQPDLGGLQEADPLAPRDLCPQPAQVSALCPTHQGWRPPDRFLVPTQTLFSKTSEALDELLQTFITQNPTADELHFLLSVRAGVAAAGPGQEVDRGGCPRRVRA